MRIVIAPLFLAACVVAGEPEWPGFRGPFSNPSVTNSNLPEKWSTTSNIEWRASVPGLGWSSPIVAGKNIFLTTVTTDGKAKQPQTGTTYSNDYTAELLKQGLKGKELRDLVNARDFEFPDEVALHYFLYSIDLESGKINWTREFYAGRPPGGRHRKNSFCSETPVTDGKRVYVYINNLGVFAYNFDGSKAWNTRLESFPTVHDFGTASSPTLVNDLMVFVNDNEKEQFIAALDKNTGKPAWRTNRSIHLQGSDRQTGWSTPYVWRHPMRTEIVTVGPGVAISYDLEGKELWRLGGMSAMPIPSPFAYDGLLYLNGGSGKAVAAVKAGASGDLTTPEGANLNASVAWLQPKAGTYLLTELAYDGGLYVLTHTGILTRFDAKTGVQTYKARVGGGGDFTSSPWGYNGKVFCINEEGRTYVIRAGDKYEELARPSPGMRRALNATTSSCGGQRRVDDAKRNRDSREDRSYVRFDLACLKVSSLSTSNSKSTMKLVSTRCENSSTGKLLLRSQYSRQACPPSRLSRSELLRSSGIAGCRSWQWLRPVLPQSWVLGKLCSRTANCGELTMRR